MSLKLWLYIAFLAVVVLLLPAAWWLRRRFGVSDETAPAVRRIVKNAFSPMAAQLVNKLIDLGFAMFVLRALGPEGNGRYAFAVLIWLYASTITDFGLGVLLTREVARDRAKGNAYFVNTTIIRWALCLASLPFLLALTAIYLQYFGLNSETAIAILVLIVGLIPGSVSAAASSLFNAYEQMEVPAWVTIITNVLKVILGIGALYAGFGIVGLAGASVVVNVITAGVFLYLVKKLLFPPRLEFDVVFSRTMLGLAYPLLLNNLLVNLFFKVDVFILQSQGARVVGLYDAAYKFINVLLIVPSYFTLAIFPLMSRYAESARDSLRRAYRTAVKGLLLISLPVTVGTVFLASDLILLFGGHQYLPESATALQILIWFLPFSYVNGVTQYALIAVNRQRAITLCFALTVAFNVVANLILIPQLSYIGASLVTVGSEIVLMTPFYFIVRRDLGGLPLAQLGWRPTVAAGVMGVAMWRLGGVNPFLLVAIGGVVYAVVLFALRTFTPEEVAMVRQLVGRPAEQPPG
ncbi:MAG: flippase [Chloroflexi bacterium]|nr:flippase [Chloroflexota bacterium]